MGKLSPQCKERVFFESESIPKFLDQVYEVYGGYDADQLESITHAEEPWTKARNGCSIGAYSRNAYFTNRNAKLLWGKNRKISMQTDIVVALIVGILSRLCFGTN